MRAHYSTQPNRAVGSGAEDELGRRRACGALVLGEKTENRWRNLENPTGKHCSAKPEHSHERHRASGAPRKEREHHGGARTVAHGGTAQNPTGNGGEPWRGSAHLRAKTRARTEMKTESLPGGDASGGNRTIDCGALREMEDETKHAHRCKTRRRRRRRELESNSGAET
jgi:hypothetical protein